MRSRNIKPGFFKNEELAECSLYSRLLFAGLWCMADREGRLEKRPLRIKAEIFPYDSLDINGELTVLERRKFVQTYVVDGKEYLQVINFKKHQSPHHTEARSKIPEMTEENKITVSSPLNNGEYPPDSLILRFTDSLIPETTATTTRAQKQLIDALQMHHEKLKEMFPEINLTVSTEKLLSHHRDGPVLLDPYMTALKWFQNEFKPGASNGNRSSSRAAQTGRKTGLIEANGAGTDFLS